ncbi:MAG: hypothetical protein HYX92_10210 [Chloroflexi bacterium]|nr:hypothetical protein [Chloroflexota bacterium]
MKKTQPLRRFHVSSLQRCEAQEQLAHLLLEGHGPVVAVAGETARYSPVAELVVAVQPAAVGFAAFATEAN